jgi:hypothetical protein
MEFILIHKPLGVISPEVMLRTMEQVRELLAKPDRFVPGGKLIASYGARGKSFVVCVWEAPSADAFCSFIEHLVPAGWETDIMPAEKMSVQVEKYLGTLKTMNK